MKSDSKAVIYPAATVAGYGHIYSLGVAGIPVVALFHSECVNFRSRYVTEKYVVPDPEQDADGFVQWLVDYARKQEHKPVLFMAEDVYAYIVSVNQDVLSRYCLYPYIAAEKLNVFFSKDAMHECAAEAGLAVPKTMHSPLDEGDIEAWGTFPAALKPLVSRFAADGKQIGEVRQFPTLFGGKAVRVENTNDLRRYAARLEQAGIDYCVQALIDGANRNIANIKFVSDADGKIPACFISRKVRQQPPDFGTCCVSVAEHIDELREYAEAFCKQAGYSGPAGIEFKWSDDDKAWYFVEINPRLDYWMRMAALKGANLAQQQYLLATGQPLLEAKQRDGGRYWIDIPGDLAGLAWRRRRKEWRLSWWKILGPYLRFDEAVFNWRDPWPGLRRLVGGLRECLRRAGERTKGTLLGLYKYLFVTLLIGLVPDNNWGNRIRGRLWRPLLGKCGRNLCVAPRVRILRPQKVTLGDNVYIGYCAYFGDGTITIGDNVLIGVFASITPSNHVRAEGTYRFTGAEDLGVIVKDNCWIGGHVCLLAGTVIESGCVVGAGAVVSRSTIANSLVTGVPAEVKKFYDEAVSLNEASRKAARRRVSASRQARQRDAVRRNPSA